jgi:hypothetical protein
MGWLDRLLIAGGDRAICKSRHDTAWNCGRLCFAPCVLDDGNAGNSGIAPGIRRIDLAWRFASVPQPNAYFHQPNTSRPIDQRRGFCSTCLPRIHLS